MAAVILLDPVVEPATPPVPGDAPQLALLLHLAQRTGIALETVGHDLARVAGALRPRARLKKRLAAFLSRLALSRKSIVWPVPSTARKSSAIAR